MSISATPSTVPISQFETEENVLIKLVDDRPGVSVLQGHDIGYMMKFIKLKDYGKVRVSTSESSFYSF